MFAKNKQLITEESLQIKSSELAEKDGEISQLVEDYSGYISDSRQQTINNRRYHSYTIRVPQDKFEKLLLDLEKLGEVTEKRINTRDVTEEYIDLTTRKENLTAQETRYRDLLEEANAVEEILQIEKELNRVRTEIERIQSRLDYYDSRVNLSTLNLRLIEPAPLFSSRRLPESLRQAVSGFINSIHLIIIFTGNMLPWLVLLTAALTMGYKLIKKKRNS